MMQREFEELAGRKVTPEQYRAIETLYMGSNLNKQDFVKSIRTMLKSIPEAGEEKNIKKMCVRDRSGFRKTPNGCWFHIKYVEFVDIDVKTGKYIVRELEEKDFEKLVSEGVDLHYSTDFDFDYMKCIDTQRKEIRLTA